MKKGFINKCWMSITRHQQGGGAKDKEREDAKWCSKFIIFVRIYFNSIVLWCVVKKKPCGKNFSSRKYTPLKRNEANWTANGGQKGWADLSFTSSWQTSFYNSTQAQKPLPKHRPKGVPPPGPVGCPRGLPRGRVFLWGISLVMGIAAREVPAGYTAGLPYPDLPWQKNQKYQGPPPTVWNEAMVKYSGFGQENIPGFIPVYSGLFQIFPSPIS
jgi:hypothetical protein